MIFTSQRSMSGEIRKLFISFWILLNVISVPLTWANDVSYCVKKNTYHNNVLKGGLEAGDYMPWEPADVSHMTVDKCTEHCCESQDTDVVFLLNSYCFCVRCHSKELCSLVKITPPANYTPITVTVLKSISKLSTPTALVSHSRTLARRTQPTEFSTQSTTVKLEQKETKGTKRSDHVTTEPGEETTDHGLGRRNGTEIGINLTTPYNVTSAGPSTPRPTRMVKTEKKAEGTGNDDISLQCPGTLKVIRVRAFGIPGDNGTVADFDKHCQANLGLIDGTNVCIVSLKRVYKTSYPPFIKTLVTFTCSYTEFAS